MEFYDIIFKFNSFKHFSKKNFYKVSGLNFEKKLHCYVVRNKKTLVLKQLNPERFRIRVSNAIGFYLSAIAGPVISAKFRTISRISAQQNS